MSIWSIENTPDISSDLEFHLNFGNISLGMLLKMELTTLPFDAGKNASNGRLDPLMSIGSNGIGDPAASLLERREKVSPMDFRLAESGRNAQHDTLT